MKFAKYLYAESVPEWRKKYIDYKGLKKAIKRVHSARTAMIQDGSTAAYVPTKRSKSKDQRLSLDGRGDRHYGTLSQKDSSTPFNGSGAADIAAIDKPVGNTNDNDMNAEIILASALSTSPTNEPTITSPSAVTPNGGHRVSIAVETPSREPLLATASSYNLPHSTVHNPVAPKRGHFRNFSTQSGINILRRVSTSLGWSLPPLDNEDNNTLHSRKSSSGKNVIKPPNEMTPHEAERELSLLLLDCTQEEVEFFDMLNVELEMVEQFYKENETKLLERLELLQKQCDIIASYEQGQADGSKDKLTPPNTPASLRVLEDGTTIPSIPLTNESKSLSPSTAIIARLQQANIAYLRHLGQAWQPTQSATPSVNGDRDSVGALASEDHRIDTQIKAAKRRIRKALLEYYRNIRLLQNYRTLNQSGFVKILKKFDKMADRKFKDYYLKKMEDYDFAHSDSIQQTQGRAEELFTRHFEDGSRRRAMQLLRLPSEELHSFRAPMFRFGLYLGLGIPAIFHAVSQVAKDGAGRDSLDSRLLQIFSSFFLPVLFMLLFAINVRAWTRYHVNYKFIFEVDPRDHLHFYQFLEFPGVFFVIFAYCVAISVTNPWPDTLPSEYFPAIFIGIVLAIMFLPFNIFYYSARRWSIIVATRIFFSGLFDVQFRDFFIADELCSLVYLFTMLQLTVCTYVTDWEELGDHCDYQVSWITPFIAVLPPFWRLMQCLRRYYDSKMAWPHLANAFKYSGTIAVTFLAAANRISDQSIWKILWIIVSIFVTGYATFWDLYMDWGFFQQGSKNRFLRDELVFPYKWTYYFAMGSDLLLRAAWLLNISPSLWGIFYDHRIVAFILALLEVFRRFQWNFYRMENEHVNNCGNFRAIREIPLPFAIDTPGKCIPRGGLASQVMHNSHINGYNDTPSEISQTPRHSQEASAALTQPLNTSAA